MPDLGSAMTWKEERVSTEPADLGESIWKKPGFVLSALSAFITKDTKQYRAVRESLCPLHAESCTMTTCKIPAWEHLTSAQRCPAHVWDTLSGTVSITR